MGRCWFLTPLVLFVLLGCAPLQPIDSGRPVELSSEQGLLIVDIDTELPIRLLRMTSASPLRDIEQGRHVWMVRLRAGDYRWRELRIDRSGIRGPPVRYEIPRDEEYDFSVEAGKINYPGQLSIRRARVTYGYWGPDLIIRNRNRLGMALRALRATHEQRLHEHPLTRSGRSEDLFLEYYLEAIGGPGLGMGEGGGDQETEAQ